MTQARRIRVDGVRAELVGYAPYSMTLYELINTEAGNERRFLLVAANLAGIANALILVDINAVAQSPAGGDTRALILFVLLIALYVLCSRYTSHRTTALIESALQRIKARVGLRIACAELSAIERVKAAEICDRITESTTFISDRAGMIAALLQSLVVMVFSAAYIAWLSPPALTLVVLLCGAGAAMFVSLRQECVDYVQQTAGIRITFFERLTDLLSGFKEVKSSRQRSRELRMDITQASDALRVVGVKTNNLVNRGILIGSGDLFLVLAALVYLLRLYVPIDGKTLTALIATMMFVWGPMTNIAVGVFPYIRSNMALAHIDALEQKLEAAQREGAAAQQGDDPWHGRFTSIEARDLGFRYTADDSDDLFSIGPLDLTLHAGEVVFIVGGNGSGKSTFLKVLTGLYPPSAGALAVDGVPVCAENVAAFREMISAIFSDFHLFAKLYGLASVEEAAVQRLLVRMQLDGKTSFTRRTFSKLTLSTGQRKRLAMVVALLEDRPLCVFDEWAADQDPEFRRYFYEELIPAQKERGKTVIVVTHDDHYVHCADRVVTMEYGKIRSISAPVPLLVSP